MFGVKEKPIIPLHENEAVAAARKATAAAMSELEQARHEEKAVLDTLFPQPDSIEFISVDREAWANERVVKRHPSATLRGGHSTRRVMTAERELALAKEAQQQIEGQAKAELRQAAFSKAADLLPRLTSAIEECIELTAELEAIGRDADLPADALSLSPFTNTCGAVLARNAVQELERKISA